MGEHFHFSWSNPRHLEKSIQFANWAPGDLEKSMKSWISGYNRHLILSIHSLEVQKLALTFLTILIFFSLNYFHQAIKWTNGTPFITTTIIWKLKSSPLHILKWPNSLLFADWVLETSPQSLGWSSPGGRNIGKDQLGRMELIWNNLVDLNWFRKLGEFELN